ncbi:hypothetical protein Tco_0379633 [Tanacetum coccineum]
MAAAAETDGGGRRVEESGCGDRIDPVMRSVFGVGRKSPPEKFSGGGATAKEIKNLKLRVRALESKKRASLPGFTFIKFAGLKKKSLGKESVSKQGRTSDNLEHIGEEGNLDAEKTKETVAAATTGVSTVSAPVSAAGVTVSTITPRTPPTTQTVFDDEDVVLG